MDKNTSISKKNRPEYPSNWTSKKFDVVKKEKQLSISCRFHSTQIWSQRKKPFSNKKPQNLSIRGQITFGIQLQTFP